MLLPEVVLAMNEIELSPVRRAYLILADLNEVEILEVSPGKSQSIRKGVDLHSALNLFERRPYRRCRVAKEASHLAEASQRQGTRCAV